MAFSLSACSAKNDTQSSGTEKKNTSDNQTNAKVSLVKFYSALTATINSKDNGLNTYEGSDTPTPDMKSKASDSAAAVATALKTVQIPAELKAYQSDLETSIKDISDSYQMKADELKKDKPSLDAANAKFTQGQNELGNVFVKIKLLKPNLSKEVN